MARKLSLRQVDTSDPVAAIHATMKDGAQLPMDAFAFYNGLDYTQLYAQLFIFESQLLLQDMNASERAHFLMKCYVNYKKSEDDLSRAYIERIQDLKSGKDIDTMTNVKYRSSFEVMMGHPVGADAERPIWTIEHMNGLWRKRVADDIKAANDYLEAERILEATSLAL